MACGTELVFEKCLQGTWVGEGSMGSWNSTPVASEWLKGQKKAVRSCKCSLPVSPLSPLAPSRPSLPGRPLWPGFPGMPECPCRQVSWEYTLLAHVPIASRSHQILMVRWQGLDWKRETDTERCLVTGCRYSCWAWPGPLISAMDRPWSLGSDIDFSLCTDKGLNISPHARWSGQGKQKPGSWPRCHEACHSGTCL